MTDKIIIGAGLYGLYAALYCARKGQKVIVLEQEETPFSRATYINQARVHMGYHYPRSLSTALKAAGYFKRFNQDYGFCIHSAFRQIYATSGCFSWTDAAEFRKFCQAADIPCMDIPVSRYFKEGTCDGAFLTREFTYDTNILKDYFLEELRQYPGVELRFGQSVKRIGQTSCRFEIITGSGKEETRVEAPFVLNAAYASVNQVLRKVESFEPELYGLKYELCEIILCKVSDNLKDVGFTVMDGPFFSIMPFGKSGYHSLTSVTFTPHKTSYEEPPVFDCFQKGICSGEGFANCNICPNRPGTAWEYMSALARKYVREEYEYTYVRSLFSMKPVLKASEIDDSRPTVIKYAARAPVFLSVLSGKINTLYDLDEYLD